MPRPKVFATTPVLVVADLQRSIEFYAKLGFVEPATWGDPPAFAMMNRDGFDIMLSKSDSPSQIRPNGADDVWNVHLRIADVAAEANALRGAGLAIARGPERTDYDMIEIDVLDPDGHRICFGQDIERRPEDHD
jgi:catechol 2,3-dioxygenase-like lactoylglutathione lyase family enzyme